MVGWEIKGKDTVREKVTMFNLQAYARFSTRKCKKSNKQWDLFSSVTRNKTLRKQVLVIICLVQRHSSKLKWFIKLILNLILNDTQMHCSNCLWQHMRKEYKKNRNKEISELILAKVQVTSALSCNSKLNCFHFHFWQNAKYMLQNKIKK